MRGSCSSIRTRSSRRFPTPSRAGARHAGDRHVRRGRWASCRRRSSSRAHRLVALGDPARDRCAGRRGRVLRARTRQRTRHARRPTSAERPAERRSTRSVRDPATARPLPNPLAAATGATQAASKRASLHARRDPTTAIPRPARVADDASLPITTAAHRPSPRPRRARRRWSSTIAAPAWTEVRDANGQRLLLVTGTPGTSETVSGTPPFELTLGNASQRRPSTGAARRSISAPHVKGNVARVRLP